MSAHSQVAAVAIVTTEVAMYLALLMHSTERRCYSVAEMQGFPRQSGCVDIGVAAGAAAAAQKTA